MTSSILTGYLIFLMCLVVLWIGMTCMFNIQTPEKFAKGNFQYGKEN